MPAFQLWRRGLVVAFILAGMFYVAFRGAQGVLVPLLTALLSVAWATGVLTLLGVPLDAEGCGRLALGYLLPVCQEAL